MLLTAIPRGILAAATAAAAVVAVGDRALRNAAQSAGVVAFEHVTVVPMDRERVLKNATVIVRDGVIAAVGRDGSVAIPAGATRVEGRGRYLMPGLADMHVHTYDTDQFVNYLAHGITTIGILNGDPRTLRWRQQIIRGELLGPTIYTAGPTVDGAPAANPAFLSVATPDDGRAAIRAIADAGYDFVKVYSLLPPDTYNAIIAEANARRLPVVGHIPFRVGVDSAIRPNGQTMIAHAEEFFRGPVDSARMGSMVRAVKSAGVTVTPNMSAYVDYIRAIDDLPGILANPEMRFSSSAAYGEKLPSHNRSIRSNPAQFRAALSGGLGQFRTFTKQLNTAGVPLLLGTDTEIFGFAGDIAHVELKEMVAAGLTPYQALVAATRTPGEFVAARVPQPERFGTVAIGQRADLLLLGANPLQSVDNTERVDGVMVRGRWFPAARLAAMRDSIAPIRARQQKLALRFDSLMTARRIADAETTLRELREIDANSRPVALAVLWVKASRLLQSDTLATLRVIEWNAELYPEIHSIHGELARVYAAHGDTAKAIAAARRSLALFAMHKPALDVMARFTGAVPSVRKDNRADNH